ncbi:MAG: cytochrome c oxidase subunit 4, partial [Micrococcales bacterium]
MRTNARLFWLLAVIYLVLAAGYTAWNILDQYQGLAESNAPFFGAKFEIIGTAALAMLSIMSAFIAFYLGKTHRTQGPVPEDNPQAKISDGDSEIGFFNAWSWWP